MTPRAASRSTRSPLATPRTRALVAVSLMAAGCGGHSTVAEDQPSTGGLYANAVLMPPPPVAGACVYTATLTAPTLAHGLVDGALASSYAPTLLVGNAGTSRIAVQGAHVTLVDPADGSTAEDTTFLAAGTVEAASGTLDSYTSLQLTVMDATAIHHFTPAPGQPQKPAVAHVRLLGTTASGEKVESGDFQFPVDICSGCLVSIPPAGGSSATYCSGQTAPVGYTVPCVVGQDQPIDCQMCYATSPACHGT